VATANPANASKPRTPPPPPPPPPVVLPSVPGGRRCVFPFWWHGRWHHTCVRYDLKGEEWCSITANFTKDENWMRCDSHDKSRFHCRIPFAYGGRLHYSCLQLSMAGPTPVAPATSGFWCGLKASIASVSWSSRDWAFCESTNATTADYLKAVGWHRGLTGARLEALLKIARHRNAVQSEAAEVA
uniref:Fibronectin type-II domain-containing protein n=1 Tax=Macrostomum lignano TaxID=282301 RepID=A0A1I8I670_9PLAT